METTLVTSIHTDMDRISYRGMVAFNASHQNPTHLDRTMTLVTGAYYVMFMTVHSNSKGNQKHLFNTCRLSFLCCISQACKSMET